MRELPLKTRVKTVKARLKEGASAAVVLSSSSQVTRSRDISHPFRQESDFYYLTGISEPGYTLLLSSNLSEPILLTPPVDQVRVVWDGAGVPATAYAKRLGAKLIETNNPKAELLKSLKGIDLLYYQNSKGSLGREIANDLFNLSSHLRGALPSRFAHIDTLLTPLRLIKDRVEIDLIRRAAQVTNAALFGALSLIEPGASEQEVSGVIEFYFRSSGAVPAFSSIVASGASAATLHYHKLAGTLKKGDLLLLDVGAEMELYSGDISRVLPVSGRFTTPQKDLYQVVLNAQKSAIRKMRPGTAMIDVQRHAIGILTEGLVDMGVLRGKVSKLIASQAYKKYFPHSIGHPLGLDVHDVGTASSTPLLLKPGMVLTVEPGLYFAKKTGKIPACGIRIEDDILITKGAPEVLSEGFPKECAEIEALFD
jgi:Xaa-Pro aminopeptidase